MAKPAVRVACVAEGGKVALPEGLCDRFVRAVQAAANRPVTDVSGGKSADLLLVVTQAGPHAFGARIDSTAGAGEARAMARRGAVLDGAAYDAFLADLVATAPLP